MRWHASRLHLEAADTFACGDHLAAVAAWLGDEHVARLFRFCLDQTARGRAPDLLVRREQEGDRQLRGLRARDLPECLEREIRAPLHVEQAGPVELVAVAAKRERAGQR